MIQNEVILIDFDLISANFDGLLAVPRGAFA